MHEKGEKKLCWNCDGYIGVQLYQCPYCGVDIHAPGSTFANEVKKKSGKNLPKDFSVSDEEWKEALHSKNLSLDEGEELKTLEEKKDTIGFLLLLPGIVFFLFGLALIFFSEEGILTLRWNQNYAYFYFLGAAPLIYLGWRTFR